jgi:hypothetical protein
MWEREYVIEELVKYFGEDFREEIEETLDLETGRYADWGNAGSVIVDGVEYNVIENEEEAKRIAIEVAKQDLEHNPEIFTRDFLSDYVYITDTDINMILADEEDFIRGEVESEYEVEDEEMTEEEIAEEIDKIVEERLSEIEDWLRTDPIGYFVDELGTFTLEDLLKQPFIQIDVERAARDAVAMDGWAHFLSLYDGNYETTSGGIVIFRE